MEHLTHGLYRKFEGVSLSPWGDLRICGGERGPSWPEGGFTYVLRRTGVGPEGRPPPRSALLVLSCLFLLSCLSLHHSVPLHQK